MLKTRVICDIIIMYQSVKKDALKNGRGIACELCLVAE